MGIGRVGGEVLRAGLEMLLVLEAEADPDPDTRREAGWEAAVLYAVVDVRVWALVTDAIDEVCVPVFVAYASAIDAVCVVLVFIVAGAGPAVALQACEPISAEQQ